jgi:mRNA interferase RelE/StbE
VWSIRYAESVIRADIPQLSHPTKEWIKRAVETKLTLDPVRFGKPLRYSLYHLRCLRVGDYRVLYSLSYEENVVRIVSIGHRKDIYKP